MPGRKRGREDAEEEGDISKQSVEEFETKRGRGNDGESPIRPNSRASDKGSIPHTYVIMDLPTPLLYITVTKLQIILNKYGK